MEGRPPVKESGRGGRERGYDEKDERDVWRGRLSSS
jgi:hypothetical protein